MDSNVLAFTLLILLLVFHLKNRDIFISLTSHILYVDSQKWKKYMENGTHITGKLRVLLSQNGVFIISNRHYTALQHFLIVLVLNL